MEFCQTKYHEVDFCIEYYGSVPLTCRISITRTDGLCRSHRASSLGNALLGRQPTPIVITCVPVSHSCILRLVAGSVGCTKSRGSGCLSLSLQGREQSTALVLLCLYPTVIHPLSLALLVVLISDRDSWGKQIFLFWRNCKIFPFS